MYKTCMYVFYFIKIFCLKTPEFFYRHPVYSKKIMKILVENKIIIYPENSGLLASEEGLRKNY